MPETTSGLSVRLLVFVKKRSRMLLPRVGSETVCVSPKFCAMSMKRLLMGKGYWWFSRILKVFQSMLGRLKSPASQKWAFLNLSLISAISSMRSAHWSKGRSGDLYAQPRMMGGFLGTFNFTKMDSDFVPFLMKILLRDFFTQRITPPPFLPILSRLCMS